LSFFELLFYALVLFSIPILSSIVLAFVRGKRRTAWMTLRVYLILVALYAAALVATTLATPLEVLVIGDAQYVGDWSVTVSSLRRFPHNLDEDYEVDFRLFNQGAKALNGPKNLLVYLVDDSGNRYNPTPQPSDPPFDILVQPRRPITTTRKFVLPTNLNRVELVMVQQGLHLGWFIIGRTPFDGRTVVHLQSTLQ
jgi:hypothetical protein